MKRSGPLKRKTPLRRKTELARVSKKRAPAPALPEQLASSDTARRALQRVLQPYSENTQRAYKQAWARWVAWCHDHKLQPVPLDPVQLVAHLEGLSTYLKPDTVRTALAAISAIDSMARGLRGDEAVQSVRSTAVVRQWAKSWGREVANVRKNKARPIDVAELVSMVTTIDDARPPQGYGVQAGKLFGARDRALLVIGWFAAMRRSELAELDVDDVRETARGVEITIKSSKTDQAGAGAVVALHRQPDASVCPLMVWRAWLAARRAAPVFPEGDRNHGHITSAAFPSVERSGALRGRMGEKAIERTVKKRAAAAGIVATPHSLRGGFATSAALHGKESRDIQHHGRWKSATVMNGYVQRSTAWNLNPTRDLSVQTERNEDADPDRAKVP